MPGLHATVLPTCTTGVSAGLHWWAGKSMKACYGTTKYCNAFLKGLPCNNVECLYLHDVGGWHLHALHAVGALFVPIVT